MFSIAHFIGKSGHRETQSVVACPPLMSPLTRYVVETAVTLAAVIALALLIVYGARRTGVSRTGGPLELVGRLPLDGRRSVYLVRVGTTVYILGASEAGLTKLGEVPEHGMKIEPGEMTHGPFREVLHRALGKKTQQTNLEACPPAEPVANPGSGSTES